MKLLNSEETAKTLIELVNKHRKVSFAVAWANINKVFDAFKKNKSKIQSSVIGTHFHQTHPDVLEWYYKCYQENPGTAPHLGFIIEEPANSVFHPKIYLFWSRRKWDLLIGSANLTTGGMDRNTELVLHVSSNEWSDEELVKIAREKIVVYWEQSTKGKDIKESQVDKYRFDHQKNKVRPKSFSKDSSIKTPELLHMNWSDFYTKVQEERDDLIERREFLRKAQETFNKNSTFFKLDYSDRTALAGTVKYGRKTWDGMAIHAFGPIQGNNFHKGLIEKNNVHVSRALDYIPIKGSVSREDYLNCVGEIIKAFGDPPHGGLAFLTRLLVVKRPDFFVAFNTPIKRRLHKGLGLKPRVKPTQYERYWDEVLVTIFTHATWYNSRPRKRSKNEIETWKYRVAMLDSICYDP